MSSNTAFFLLSQLASHGATVAKGLPAQIDITPHWSGVGFELAGYKFVAPAGQLIESLDQPQYTALPSVQSYVMGVANVRGRLLPIIDFAAVFGLEASVPSREQRLITIEVGDLYAGLTVDRVLGMQHFPQDQFSKVEIDGNESLASIVSGAYDRGTDDLWWLVDVDKLISHPRFMQVAR